MTHANCPTTCPAPPAPCTLGWFASPCMCTTTGAVTTQAQAAEAAPQQTTHSRRRTAE